MSSAEIYNYINKINNKGTVTNTFYTSVILARFYRRLMARHSLWSQLNEHNHNNFFLHKDMIGNTKHLNATGWKVFS